jgi:hypothetical protein
MYTKEDDDDDDYEMKPDLSDDESYPGIVGDDHKEDFEKEDEDEEEYGRIGKGKKGKGGVKGKGKPSTPRKPKASSVGGSGKKPPVAWTADEDLILFNKMHPKVNKPDWKEIGLAVQRDAKVKSLY